MRIAHVISYFQPEFGYHEYYVPREQAAMGHEVHLITSDRIFPFKNVEKMLSDVGSEHRGRFRGVGVTEMDGFTVHRGKTKLEILFDLIVYDGVERSLRKIEPDVVHAHGLWQWGSRVAASLKDELGYALVLDEHAYSTTYDMSPTPRNWLLDKEYRMLRAPAARKTLSKADAVVGICQEAKEFVEEFYKVKNVLLNPLGIDHRNFTFSEEGRRRVRKEMGLGDGDILLITAGRLDRAKNLEPFIEAHSHLGRDDIRMAVIGRGDEGYLSRLKELSSGNVSFLGFRNPKDLRDHYSAADIGFWGKASITIREAMSCSLPVILYDQGNMTDLLKWDNGIAVKEDVEEIGKAFLTLADDPEMRERMGKNARRGVMEELSSEREARELVRIYEEALEKRSPGATSGK